MCGCIPITFSLQNRQKNENLARELQLANLGSQSLTVPYEEEDEYTRVL